MASILDFRRALLRLATVMALGACATSGTARVGGLPDSPAAAPGADPVRQREALARADSAWQAGAYPMATDLYEAIAADDSSSHIAIFRLATLRSWDNRLDEAIALFRRYVAVEPDYAEGRLALARAVAWSGRYSSAVAIYDSVITLKPTNREAVLGRAQTLAWAGRFEEALSAYREWTIAHPPDRAASIEYARTLSWSGRLDDAESLYAQLARTGSAHAKKGLARVIGWRGDLQRSEDTWRQVLITDPADAEALTGLAQVLSWQGRQAEAETALQLALQANPAYGDARTLLRWVQADLRPSVTVTGAGGNDSDNNREISFLLDYAARAPWNGTVGARYMQRLAKFGVIDSRDDAVRLSARWQPEASSWQLRADAGVSRHYSTFLPTPARDRTIVSGTLGASGTVGRSVTIGLAASRTPFDGTALLIATGVVASEIGGEAGIALPARFSLSGTASHARFTGGARENSRNALSSAIRWKHNRRWSLAVAARRFGYDTTSSDGYFAPKKYTLTEASGRGRVGGDLGWNADGDVGLGRQSIDFFGSSAGSRLAERVALTAGYRLDPAREVSVSSSYTNIAAPGQIGGSEYSAYTFSLRARVGF